MNEKVKLDRIDQNILSIMQGEARITNQQLADRVGLSPSSCLNRVRKLEEGGCIGPYRSVVDLETVCRSITCIAAITLEHHTQDDFRTFEHCIANIPEVVECYTVSGACDFFLRVVCPDMRRYHELNEELLNSGANVINISTYVVMNENKQFSGFPLEKLL